MFHGSSGFAGEQQCSTHVYQDLPRSPFEIRRALYASLAKPSPVVMSEFWFDPLTGVVAEYLTDWAGQRVAL